jgi:hypothetical protein
MKPTSGDRVRVLEALAQLLRYDIEMALLGFRRTHRSLAQLRVRPASRGPEVEKICSSMACAMALYWKPVHCLQRSVATARLLRRHGSEGRLVIGYRPTPFFSHAWVEVNGVVVNDSPEYQKRLRVLETV